MHKVELRLIHLDMLRGLAAIGVVLGHIRSFVVVDYAAANTTSLLDQAIYFITGLGHQCVIAFFALSGFLVGGSALRGILAGKWGWPRYIVRRITRLWIVLIPALMLTLGVDTAGQIVGGHAGYDGAFYHLVNSGPKPTEPADLSLGTIIANAFFLQTILSPTLGTNGPLWSLANEFWYYIMFPLLFAGLVGKQHRVFRGVMVSAGAALAMLLPIEMVLLGLIWVAGAAAYYFLSLFSTSNKRVIWWGLLLASVAVFGMTVVDKYRTGVKSDILLGLAFACLLPILALLPSFGSVYERAAGALANISYTLYATHFPVLAFIWFVALAPNKWTIGPTAAALVAALAATALLVASGMWWLFERHTERVRSVLEAWLFSRSKHGREKWRALN
jgi:peptidoglycan/LPS O-acetylase OafA/YrhL